MDQQWKTDMDIEESREKTNTQNQQETQKTINSETEPTMEELWMSHSLSLMENSKVLSEQILQLQRANARLVETQNTLMQTIQGQNQLIIKQRAQMRSHQKQFSTTLLQLNQTIEMQETQIEELHAFNNELILVQIGQLPNIPNLPETGEREIDWTSL